MGIGGLVLLGNGQRLVHRNWPLRDPISQCWFLDQLQHQPMGAVFNAIDRGNARMVEAGKDVGFSLEAGETAWISREGVRQDLQGDIAIQSGSVA